MTPLPYPPPKGTVQVTVISPKGKTVQRQATPGPVRRCYSAVCNSFIFWQFFPWMLTYTVVTFAHLQVLFVTMRIFSEFEDPMRVGTVWIQALGISLLTGWLVQDPVVIIIRNNLKMTKTIIRSKKYQVLEKFVVQPFRLVLNCVINYVRSAM